MRKTGRSTKTASAPIPWVFTYELPLLDLETNGQRLFATSSFGGRQCIGRLARTYAQRQRKDPGKLPVITLGCEMLQARNLRHRAKPGPKIVEWLAGSGLVATGCRRAAFVGRRSRRRNSVLNTVAGLAAAIRGAGFSDSPGNRSEASDRDQHDTAHDEDDEPDPVDETTIYDFLALLHEHAAAALDGVAMPGVMNLCRFLPDRGLDAVFRFSVGDISSMAEQAVADARAGFNVYVEGRTVRPGLGRKMRGSAADTVGVFGLVIDSDADKHKAGLSRLTPSLVVETSPGNSHQWLFLDRAIDHASAAALGDAMRLAGGDSDNRQARPAIPGRRDAELSGPAQARARPRHLPDTYPCRFRRRLQRRGNFQRISTCERRREPLPATATKLSADELMAFLDPKLRDDITRAPDPDDDRSALAFSVILRLILDDFSDAAIHTIFTAHPDAIGQRYVRDGKDLGADIARARRKARQHDDSPHRTRTRQASKPDAERPASQLAGIPAATRPPRRDIPGQGTCPHRHADLDQRPARRRKNSADARTGQVPRRRRAVPRPRNQTKRHRLHRRRGRGRHRQPAGGARARRRDDRRLGGRRAAQQAGPRRRHHQGSHPPGAREIPGPGDLHPFRHAARRARRPVRARRPLHQPGAQQAAKGRRRRRRGHLRRQPHQPRRTRNRPRAKPWNPPWRWS